MSSNLKMELSRNQMTLLLRKKAEIENKCCVKLLLHDTAVEIAPMCLTMSGDSCVEQAFFEIIIAIKT